MRARNAIILFCFASLSLACSTAVAQSDQDNQPHITPRKAPPEPTPKPKPKPTPVPQDDQPRLEGTPEASPQAPRESSSKDSQVDFNGAPLAKEPAPAPEPEEGTFTRYNPHQAEKDIEVGNYYLRHKNYRAALERFNSALINKPKDAEATFGLAVTQEKLDLLSQAYKNYEGYLKILDAGPHAKECQEAIKRLGPHVDVRKDDIRKDSKRQAERDIDVGETYLSVNKFQAAQERFQEALLLEPENPVAVYRMAQSLRGLRHLDSAKRFYQKYLELAPKGTFAADAKKAVSEIDSINR